MCYFLRHFHKSNSENLPRSGFRLRFSFRFCRASLPELGFIPKTPLPGQRRRFVSDAVLAVSLTECFFTTHTPCRQSCCGNRIAPPNPAAATGLLHPILLWQQDCSTQSCCGNRIENSTRNSTRGNSEKMGHACFQFRTPRGQQPKNGWCLFPVRGTSKAQVPLMLSSTFLPGIASRPRHLPGIEALPSPRQGEFFPAKKCRGCRLSDNLCEIFFQPTWRHAADVSHQLRSSGRFRRPLAPSCAGLAFDRQNRSNQIESHPKKNPGAGLVRAWCGPGAGLARAQAAEPALCGIATDWTKAWTTER